MEFEEKNYVGMGYSVCPVCLKEHSESVLLDTRLKKSLTRHEFAGWELCEEHNKLYVDGYIALVECVEEPKNIQSANRTGNIVHIKLSVWSHIFNTDPPTNPMVFIGTDVFNTLRTMLENEEH